MACSGCGSDHVIIDNYQHICNDCGSIQSSNYLVGVDSQEITGSSFSRFKDEYRGPAFEAFKQMYHSCTLTLNSTHKINDEGALKLPKLWDVIKLMRIKNKKVYLFALLFLLHRTHNVPVIARQFQKKAMLTESQFGRAITYVAELFNFPSMLCLNLIDMINNNINELKKYVFKESNTALEKIVGEVAVRLAKVIHDREWCNKQSNMYVSHIASVSVIICGQYALVNKGGVKAKQCRHAKFRLTKKSTLDYQKVANHVCLHVRVVQQHLKDIQEKLFEIAKKIPWKPKFVTTSAQIGLILIDILDYIDLDLNESLQELEEEVETQNSNQHISAIIKAIFQLNTTEKDEFTTNWIQQKCFSNLIKKELASCEPDCKPSEKLVVIDNNSLKINESNFSFGQLNLFKDLFDAGCSLEKLLAGDYMTLVQTYLDINEDDHVDDDSIHLEPLTAEESFLYLKDPSFNA